MKHVNINASQAEQVTSEMLDTLALLCGMSLDETSDLVGSLISEFGFHDTKAKLMARFPHLALQIDTLWVRFADDEVRKVLGKNVKGDENANLTLDELVAVKDVKEWFRNNKSVKYFDEFALTSVSKVSDATFKDCTLLHLSTPECLTVFPKGFIGNQYSTTKITRLNSSVEGMINTGAVKTIEAGGPLGTSLGTLGKVIFAPHVEEAGEACVSQNALCRAVFFPNVRKIGLRDIGAYNRHLVYNNNELRILDIGVHELTDSRALCCHSNLIMRSFVVPEAEHLNETKINQGAVIYVPSGFIDDYKKAENWSVNAGRIYAIGGSHWQSYMQQLAEEEGKTFDDYSLRYIDYDIYGVDYATDELNALSLSIPDEYLGRDGETFVFDSAPLAIGYDPEPTRKEYFTLSKSGSDGVSVADTETRFIKMLTMNAANAGSAHDVTFTAVSAQVEGVKAVRTFKCAYPLISSVNLSFGNQFVSAALESNTDNAKYTQLEFSSEGGVGVSDNGWVYANAHGEAATGSVTVRSKTTPSSVSSIEVSVTADAVQRQRFADAEVERVILSKKVGNKGNVVGEDDFSELTDITEWFRGNTAITLFPELADTNVRVLKNDAFRGCASLTKLDTHNIEIFSARCLNETRVSEIDLSSCKVAYRYAFGIYLASNTVKKLIISSMEQYEDISVGETDGSVWGINNQAPRQPDCELYIGDAKWNGAYVATRDTLRHSLFLNCPCLYHADLRSVKIMNEWSMAFCSNLIDVYLPEEPFERKGRREVLSGNKNTIYYVPSEESKKKWTGDTSWNWDKVLPEDNFKVIGQ